MGGGGFNPNVNLFLNGSGNESRRGAKDGVKWGEKRGAVNRVKGVKEEWSD